MSERLRGWSLPIYCLGLGALLFRYRQGRRRDRVIVARGQAIARPPPLDQWPYLPRVTALVAAWCEGDNIEPLIDSFFALRYPEKEMIVCAGGEDGTYELARQMAGPEIKVLKQKKGEGKQRALARSLPSAGGEVIFLTDADCRFRSDDFERLIYPLAIDSETVTTGASRPHDEDLARPFIYHQWAPTRYAQLMTKGDYSGGLLGRNCAVKRRAIERAWSSEVDVPTGTDYYLALRLRESGYKIRYFPDSQVETRYPTTVRAYVRQQARWTRNLLLLGLRHRDWVHVRSALVSGTVGTVMLLLPLGAIATGPAGLAVWMVAWSAALLNRHRYASFVGQIEGRRPPLYSVNLLLVMLSDFVAWARIFWDIWKRENREQW